MPYMHLIEDDCLKFDSVEIHIMHAAKSGNMFFVVKNEDGDMIIFTANEPANDEKEE